eukprot:COSAG01_NODE_3078_length_6628_cov_30.180885_3_plen_94_part_00
MLTLAREGDQHAAWLMWVGMAVLWVVTMTTMFTAQMEFFAGIADPRIGGTYMTLLNTIANLGNTWPKATSLYRLRKHKYPDRNSELAEICLRF